MAVKYSLISRKAVIVFSLIVILIMGAIVGVNYLKKALTVTTIPSDEVMFENMFSGSRYFFRIGYPNGWSYETGAYGFYLDEERQEVVELFPQKAIEETDTREPNATNDKNIQYERIPGCTIKIFHENIENPELTYTAENAMDDLLLEIGKTEGYTFGTKSTLTTENVTMCKTDFEYTEEETLHKCSLYTVTRAMCKYVIVTDCTDELLPKYSETIGKMLTDFRFSVFEH